MRAFSSAPVARTTRVLTILTSHPSNLVLEVFGGKIKRGVKVSQGELMSELWNHKQSSESNPLRGGWEGDPEREWLSQVPGGGG